MKQKRTKTNRSLAQLVSRVKKIDVNKSIRIKLCQHNKLPLPLIKSDWDDVLPKKKGNHPLVKDVDKIQQNIALYKVSMCTKTKKVKYEIYNYIFHDNR